MIELMLTVSFVMLGALLIQGSYMRSAEIFGRYTHSLQSIVWMEERLAKVKEGFLVSDNAVSSESGVLQDGGKNINWTLDVSPTSGENLYSVGMTLTWKEGPKTVQIEGERYVFKNPKAPAF